MKKADVWETACRVWGIEGGALTDLKGIVDRAAFHRCVEVIARCRGRILTAGVGTSAAAARKIAHSLSCVERPAFYLSPGDAVHGGLGSAQRGDVAILISKGGSTREVVNIIPALKAKGVYLISVTENERSAVAKEGDLLVKIRVKREADEFNMLATASTLAVIAVFDAVCVALMKATDYRKEQFALIHPGGAVGERLKHVSKGMRKGAPREGSRL